MKITDSIRQWWQSRRKNVLLDNSTDVYGGLQISRKRFADVIFCNIYELLTDLVNDVTLILKSGGDAMLFAGFRSFFDAYAHIVLNRLFEQGYVIIGHRDWNFWLMEPQEYTTVSDEDATLVRAYDPTVEVYVMRSLSWQLRQMSDKQFLSTWLDYLDKVLNGSYTISEKLGSFLILSPSNPANAPTVAVLTAEQKTELEKQIEKEYGNMRNQRSVMLLKRPMTAQVINMTGLDLKTNEKVRMAVLAICDRIKVPANQVAIIDANSSKSLSNGSELREGDFNKYQSFERLLNRTFVQMAQAYGMTIDYTIYNKPTRITQ